MKIKFNFLLIITGFIIAMYSATISAQNTSRISLTTIESVVVDENGNPVAGALVRGNEGAVFTRTDNSGRFKISVPAQSELFIESEGYESAIFTPFQYMDEAQLQLITSPLLEGQRDSVHIAFNKISQKKIANAISVINPDELRKYDNIKSVSEALSGRVLGMYGGSNIRGIGEPLYVVDGLPRSIDNLNLSEIEQITVLKDINSSILYGSQAQNGVVLITTKRGEAFKKDMKVTGYYGANTPLALPNYLSSAEYMQLHNEARINDGLPALYGEEMINNFQTGNPYRYPNVDYYSSDYIKQIKPFWKTMLELSGGNDKARYYVNAGWERIGSYLNFGEGKNANQNKFNVRGNVDMTLSSWITTALDASAFFNNTRNPRGSFWSEAATTHPHTNAPLIPISLIDPENELLLGRKNDVDGLYLLGGSSAYLTNAIAHAYSAGYVERSHRTFTFNNRVNFDLDRVLEGLSFHTNISFDFYSVYDQAIQNEYSVYEPVWADHEDKIVDLIKYGDDIRPGVHYAGNSQYNRRIGIYGMFDYKRIFHDDHEINASLLGFSSTYDEIGDYQGVKNYTAGLRVNYAYLKKYLIDFSSAYVHSNKLAAGNRGAYSPSLGLAWLISAEDFMQSASAIDYLKLRLSAGILNTDVNIGGFFLHADRYGSSGSYQWYDGAYSRAGTVAVQGGNPKLGFEKYKDINLGLDGQFFDRHLLAGANVFSKAITTC
jgi:TonB-dependent Receptor Plug Domain.